MLKGLLFIVLMVFIVGAVILLVAVNYIMLIIRRIRRHYFGNDNDYSSDENIRRHSNQYKFRHTSYTSNNRQSNQYSSYSSQEGQQEVIVDTRDPHTANRQIISDDEGEYVDFEEEK